MSYNVLATAMQQFWRQSSLPIYAEGQVPDGASYPYLTWQAQLNGSGQTHTLRVTCWYAQDWAGCTAMLARLTAMLPRQGVLIPIGSGYGLLWREGASAARTAQPGNISAGTLSMGMRLYEGGMDDC